MDLLSMQASTAFDNEKSGSSSMPSWGSYLYQNFLVPAFSPTASFDWLNTPSLQPLDANSDAQHPAPAVPIAQPQDYFGLSATTAWQTTASNSASGIKTEVIDNANAAARSNLTTTSTSTGTGVQRSLSLDRPQQLSFHHQHQQQSQAGPSSFYPQPFYYQAPSVINTSLLTQSVPPAAPLPLPNQQTSSDSVNVVDADIARTRSPSPLSSHVASPHESPISRAKVARRGTKRSHSIESDMSHSHDEHEHDHEPEVPEGVERDGMIWGMKVEDYRALSARERKRVRNRISARTFRAKRKEHLSSLEVTLGAKDLQIKLAHEETTRLKREVTELKKRLAKYEKPYDRPL